MLDPFLYLLRAGLWGKLDDERELNCSPEDWVAIYQMAHKQAVAGIIFDGIVLLPENQLPPRELLQHWYGEVRQLEAENRRQIGCITQLEFLLTMQHQIPFHVIKGQCIAQLYRNRLHRSVGDIDLWFSSPQLVEQANVLMEQQGARLQRGKHQDSAMGWNGQEIEHHYHLIELHNPFLRKELKAWEKSIHEQSKNGPLPVANLLLQITHILKHQLNGGIGMKQLCDLAVSFCTLDYDRQELVAQARKYGVYRFSKLLASFVSTYLGVSQDRLPFPATENPAALMNEIWEAGEFGHYDTRFGNRPAGKWSGKCYTLNIILHKAKVFFFYAPGESFWWTAGLVTARLKELFFMRK